MFKFKLNKDCIAIMPVFDERVPFCTKFIDEIPLTKEASERFYKKFNWETDELKSKHKFVIFISSKKLSNDGIQVEPFYLKFGSMNHNWMISLFLDEIIESDIDLSDVSIYQKINNEHWDELQYLFDIDKFVKIEN